jgi:alanine racemase
MQRAWIEVDLRAIRENVASIRRFVGGRGIIAVIKSNAYGHGLLQVAKALEGEEGVRYLGVASVEEAVSLKENGVSTPILVMGPSLPCDASEIVERGLVQMVDSIDLAYNLSKEAQRRGKEVEVHLKVDTGMGRMGVLVEDLGGFLKEIRRLDRVRIGGVATHFSRAEDPECEVTRMQISRMRTMLRILEDMGMGATPWHAANSAAITSIPESLGDMVRPGLLIYGIPPFRGSRSYPPLTPALSLKSTLSQIKELPEGHPISYGATFVLKRRSRVGIVTIGYGDGYPRSASNKAMVLIRGRRVPVIGMVCMDQIIVDLTDLPEASIGDEVVLIGSQGGERIDVWDLASWSGRIAHEVVSSLNCRLPRVFKE